MTPGTATTLETTAATTRAERRRAMLERLAEIGMHLAEQVGAHAAASMAAVNEEKGGDPTRAFATVSRCIRLTLAMEARVDRQILALRKGIAPATIETSCTKDERVRRSVTPHVDSSTRGELREGLVEYDPDERLFSRPFRDPVAATSEDPERDVSTSADNTASLPPRRRRAQLDAARPSHFPGLDPPPSRREEE